MDFAAMATELRSGISPGAAILVMILGGLGTVALLGGSFLKLSDSHGTFREAAIPGVTGIIVGGLTYIFATRIVPAIFGG